ncbi:hypothetical protein GCM10020216_048770 [Nonomuraea helvata]
MSSTPFVSRVRVRGFRSMANCDVQLGPLTILAGFNAAGKSNFLDALRFVADALDSSPGKALASRGGLDRVLCHASEAGVRADSFSIDLELHLRIAEGQLLPVTYGLEIGRRGGKSTAPAVIREECEVVLPGGITKWFRATLHGLSGSEPVHAEGQAGYQARDRLLLATAAFDTPLPAVEWRSFACASTISRRNCFAASTTTPSATRCLGRVGSI